MSWKKYCGFRIVPKLLNVFGTGSHISPLTFMHCCQKHTVENGFSTHLPVLEQCCGKYHRKGGSARCDASVIHHINQVFKSTATSHQVSSNKKQEKLGVVNENHQPGIIPPVLSLENKAVHIALDIFNAKLASDADSLLQFCRAKTVNEAQDCLAHLDLRSLDGDQLCSILLTLCQLHLSDEYTSEAPVDDQRQLQLQQLVTVVKNSLHSFNNLQRICVMFCFHHLGISASDVTVHQMISSLDGQIHALSLPCLTALGTYCINQTAWPHHLVQPFLLSLQCQQELVKNWQDLNWLIIAVSCAKQYMSREKLLEYEQHLYDFVSLNQATAADADYILNIMELLVRRQALDDPTLPVLRVLVAQYLRVVSEPPATALELMGRAVHVLSEASPAVEDLLMKHALGRVASGAEEPILWRMLTVQSHWVPPRQLWDNLQKGLHRQFRSLGVRLALSARPSPALSARPSPPLSARPSPALSARPSPALSARPSPALSARPSPALSARPSPALSARPSPALSARPSPPPPPVRFTELRWTLALTFADLNRDRLERACDLCLAFLEQKSLSAETMERSVRALARVYLRSVRALTPSDGAATLLERALLRRLAAQLRDTRRPAVDAQQVAQQAAFLVAFCERQIPQDIQNRLLNLVHRDQLTVTPAFDLSKAIKYGRWRWMHGRGALSPNYLHQLNALTIALNRWTVRYARQCDDLMSVVQLAEAATARRGAVIGNTTVLDAVVERFNALMWLHERDRVRTPLVSSAVDRMARCLSHVRYRDDRAIQHMCNHVVRRRECVSRRTAMDVLQYAFNNGYLPSAGASDASSADFEQFLSATADIVSRFFMATPAYFVLRACQSLCLYGQLPVHLARSLLSQAFLDKTETEIRHWESRAAAAGEDDGSADGRDDAHHPAHRGTHVSVNIRRYQMEVNRTVRLNLPDQNLPWFSGQYARGLTDRRQTARQGQLLAEVQETAARLAGAARLVRSRVRTDGYFFTADLVLLRSRDGTFTDRDGPLVESVALLVPAISDYCINTPHLTGTQLLRKLNLEMLGFTVRVVDPHYWNSMALADDDDKLSFLAALIDGRNLLEAPDTPT